VSATDASAALQQIAADYWEGVLRRNPILATFYGDFRYNSKLPNLGPAGRAEEDGGLRETLQRVRTVDPATLDAEDRITHQMLRIAAQAGLDALRLRLDEMSVDQLDGPQVWLQEMLNFHPTDTPEHVQDLVERYLAFDGLMNDYLETLRDGIRDGRTAPTIAVERVLGQLRALVGTPPEASAMAAPLAENPAFERVAGVVRNSVYPAFERMLEFLDDYLARHARKDPGVWSVTDGAEIYALLARQHTTTELTPDELDQIGLDDLRQIHAEMRAIVRARGADDMPLRVFTKQLTADPRNLPSSRDELLEIARQLLSTAQAALPRAFGRLPRMQVVVKSIEEYRERDAPPAFYLQGSTDGSRPANLYINTFEPSMRPKHTLPALAFHEGVPGHHLQIALAQETQDLPTFRRLSAGGLANAFVEGWALYTERLADEMGLYTDDLGRYGMLGYQAWRACRLVVDSGLHHLHWSRQQAIDFFLDNVGLTERETVNEVDRYIVWPGQALAYKIGQREIEAVRRQQQAQLGEAFDLRAFHDELLRHAAVPLSALRLIFDDGR
jgi:uncharacterized protein (DUF885 family)